MEKWWYQKKERTEISTSAQKEKDYMHAGRGERKGKTSSRQQEKRSSKSRRGQRGGRRIKVGRKVFQLFLYRPKGKITFKIGLKKSGGEGKVRIDVREQWVGVKTITARTALLLPINEKKLVITSVYLGREKNDATRIDLTARKRQKKEMCLKAFQRKEYPRSGLPTKNASR